MGRLKVVSLGSGRSASWPDDFLSLGALFPLFIKPSTNKTGVGCLWTWHEVLG